LLVIQNISKTFPGCSTPVLEDISIKIREHELISLVGESGSGKTTLLRLIAGLVRPSAGSITCHERCFVDKNNWIPPEKRSVGLVFQGGALFPHMTVAQNIAYALGKLDKATMAKEVTHLLERVHLPGKSERYPHELSGGEAQRVALARALAAKPQIILFDEPYSNLDVATTFRLREEIRSILTAEKMTGILVTHDAADARHFGQRVAIIRAGRLEQVGPINEVCKAPTNNYCRLLIGGSCQPISSLENESV